MRLSADQIEYFVKAVFKRNFEPAFAEVNIDFLAAYWAKMVEAGPGVAYGIVEDSGVPAGFLLGMHTVDPMTGLLKGFEYFMFASKEFRGTRVGVQLVKEFEAGAREAGCIDAVLGCNVTYKPEALGRWYQRLGYSPLAESYRKKL